MAIQIRRTTTGTPTSLKPGQLAVELEAQPSPRLWVGTDADPRLVSPAGEALPIVSRVRIKGGSASGMSMGSAQVSLELDRPAPAGCFVQYWRMQRMSRARGGEFYQSGFRAVGRHPQNNGGLTAVSIPQGNTSVTCGTVLQLFRPANVRNAGLIGYSRYHREHEGEGWDLDLPPAQRSGKRDIKVILKFGTITAYRGGDDLWHEQRSPMSPETMRIQRWRYAWTSASGDSYHGWGFKVDCY